MYEPLERAFEGLRRDGYSPSDPWDIVEGFEDKIAKYAGSKYAVATDSCTNSLFLCLKYLQATGRISIPKKTYISVPQSIIHAGCEPHFINMDWSGLYKLNPYPIIDSATRFTKGMYVQDSYQCLSFHIRKILPIAKGGMILTNDIKAVEWFKLASYEGRNRRLPHDEMPSPAMIGWNMYMPPEQAARGLALLEEASPTNPDSGSSDTYKDLTEFEIFRKYNEPNTTQQALPTPQR